MIARWASRVIGVLGYPTRVLVAASTRRKRVCQIRLSGDRRVLQFIYATA